MAQPASDAHDPTVYRGEDDVGEHELQTSELGVDELIVFDPFPGPQRRTFTVYRREEAGLRPAILTQDDAVHSQALDCHLRRVGAGPATRLRLATGDAGNTLVPTAEESELAALADKEAALRRVAELEAELKRRD